MSYDKDEKMISYLQKINQMQKSKRYLLTIWEKISTFYRKKLISITKPQIFFFRIEWTDGNFGILDENED